MNEKKELKKDIYIIDRGRYKGWRLAYTQGGQIFPRAGWYLEKLNDEGEIEKIEYLDVILNRI